MSGIAHALAESSWEDLKTADYVELLVRRAGHLNSRRAKPRNPLCSTYHGEISSYLPRATRGMNLYLQSKV